MNPEHVFENATPTTRVLFREIFPAIYWPKGGGGQKIATDVARKVCAHFQSRGVRFVRMELADSAPRAKT